MKRRGKTKTKMLAGMYYIDTKGAKPTNLMPRSNIKQRRQNNVDSKTESKRRKAAKRGLRRDNYSTKFI